jgi:hypothetical protein
MHASQDDHEHERGRHQCPDHGQAVMLVLAVAALLAVMAMATARFAARIVAIEQAQVAADAAALAGVARGQGAAEALAARNDGMLVSFRQVGDDVIVTVEVRGASATARASRAP